MLWACLLLPSLPLDVFARAQPPADAAKPFAIATGGRTPRIVSANAGAHDAGIRAGQLVSASLALAPDLVMRDRNPATEAAALAAVAMWATQFTPAVTLAPPDAVLVEIGSSLRLFGGLSKLTSRLSAGARELGRQKRRGHRLLRARSADQSAQRRFITKPGNPQIRLRKDDQLGAQKPVRNALVVKRRERAGQPTPELGDVHPRQLIPARLRPELSRRELVDDQ